MRVDVSQLSDKYQKQIQDQLDKEDEAAAAALPAPVAPRPMNKYEKKAEKDFQVLCGNWLNLRGYHYLTADNAERQFKEQGHCLGWWGHLHNPRKNCLMPDLFIFALPNKSLQVELKVKERYQPGQKEMIEMGFWKLSTTFDDFKYEVECWEAGI